MDNTTLKKIILSNFTMKKMTLPMWYQEKIMFNILWFVPNYSCLSSFKNSCFATFININFQKHKMQKLKCHHIYYNPKHKEPDSHSFFLWLKIAN